MTKTNDDDVLKYVDENGNFTHSKIDGTKEQIAELIKQYRKTNYYLLMTDSQKILAEKFLFPQIIKTGMVPQGMLLDLCLACVKSLKDFDELKPGAKITFDLPPQFKSGK